MQAPRTSDRSTDGTPLAPTTRLQYLAGTEVGAEMFINDALPEEKAAALRAVDVALD